MKRYAPTYLVDKVGTSALWSRYRHLGVWVAFGAQKEEAAFGPPARVGVLDSRWSACVGILSQLFFHRFIRSKVYKAREFAVHKALGRSAARTSLRSARGPH